MKESKLDSLLKRLGIRVVRVAVSIEPGTFIKEPVDHVELPDTKLSQYAYFVRPYVLEDTSEI